MKLQHRLEAINFIANERPQELLNYAKNIMLDPAVRMFALSKINDLIEAGVIQQKNIVEDLRAIARENGVGELATVAAGIPFKLKNAEEVDHINVIQNKRISLSRRIASLEKQIDIESKYNFFEKKAASIRDYTVSAMLLNIMNDSNVSLEDKVAFLFIFKKKANGKIEANDVKETLTKSEAKLYEIGKNNKKLGECESLFLSLSENTKVKLTNWIFNEKPEARLILDRFYPEDISANDLYILITASNEDLEHLAEGSVIIFKELKSYQREVSNLGLLYGLIIRHYPESGSLLNSYDTDKMDEKERYALATSTDDQLKEITQGYPPLVFEYLKISRNNLVDTTIDHTRSNAREQIFGSSRGFEWQVSTDFSQLELLEKELHLEAVDERALALIASITEEEIGKLEGNDQRIFDKIKKFMFYNVEKQLKAFHVLSIEREFEEIINQLPNEKKSLAKKYQALILDCVAEILDPTALGADRINANLINQLNQLKGNAQTVVNGIIEQMTERKMPEKVFERLLDSLSVDEKVLATANRELILYHVEVKLTPNLGADKRQKADDEISQLEGGLKAVVKKLVDLIINSTLAEQPAHPVGEIAFMSYGDMLVAIDGLDEETKDLLGELVANFGSDAIHFIMYGSTTGPKKN